MKSVFKAIHATCKKKLYRIKNFLAWGLLKRAEKQDNKIDTLEKQVNALEKQVNKGNYLPMPPFSVNSALPFMRSSTCSAADLLHPRYKEILDLIKYDFDWHRKAWEFVFVIHHLLESGIIKPGSRGLVFGVGTERLPALFASMGCKILATDAPIEIGEEKGWTQSNQHMSGLTDIRYTQICDGNLFDENVSYSPCDMNNIPSSLVDYDFNWSSCCFEHLGTLEAGMEFVINAVEKTLRVGGIAVHTTEFNLSSNTSTVEEGGTVIYRHRDIVELVRRLRDRGHTVNQFTVAPDSHYYDFHVDVPPYKQDAHLRLLLDDFVCTSVGIVVQRGPLRS